MMQAKWNQPVDDDKKSSTIMTLDYYIGPFMLFHDEINRNGLVLNKLHPIRSRFWELVPQGEYAVYKARDFLKAYLLAVTSEMKAIISRNSIAYWLHVYRRLFPGSIFSDDDPATIGLTRAVLEAAFQKFGTMNTCNKVGLCNEVGVKAVFNGLLLSDNLSNKTFLVM